MIPFRACVLFLYIIRIYSSTLNQEEFVFDPKSLASINDDCDPSTIPVMASFDIKKFSGKWFELAKTVSGYIDISDGVWLIEGTNTSHKFLFSGRDNNLHCIRPLKGKISASDQPPGMLLLKYQTYSTHVEETTRVLFTDYTTIAVLYTCMHHVHHEREACHPAGLFGSIWTRQPHVNLEMFEKAAAYLEKACIHRSTLINRNVVGACRIDDLDPRIDDFPAPDYCYQPRDLGSCRGSLQRYYYEPKERMCKIFTYGGCGGNKNNFMSLSECQKKCIVSTSKDPLCISIAKCGLHCSPCCTEDENGCVLCDCEHIIEDNFLRCEKSPDACPEDCEVQTFYAGCHICRCNTEHKVIKEPHICNEVKIEGSCNSKFERYYYNALTAKCEAFVFSGCQGNNNNFISLGKCKETCEISDHVDVLQNPVHENSASSISYALYSVIFSVLFLKLITL